MNKKGFTLIELLVVIAIIGILSGIIVISVNGAINSANDARRRTDIDTIRKAVIYYKIQSVDGLYPTEIDWCTIGGGDTPCTNLASSLVSTLPNLPVDPVSGYYTYISDGIDFTISSILSDDQNYIYDSVYGFSTEEGGGGEGGGGEEDETVVGACGVANKIYNTDDLGYGNDTFCTAGTEDPSSHDFPEPDGSTSWTCYGEGGGTNDFCIASRINDEGSGILTNGDFEAGSSGWSMGGYNAEVNSYYAHSDSHTASLFSVSGQASYMQQFVDLTDSDVLTFWELNWPNGGSRSVLIGGNVVWSSTSSVQSWTRVDIDTSTYNGLQLVRFIANYDGSTDWKIDDVSAMILR